MDFLYYPLGFALLLGVVVTIHELGHFFAARIVGVHVVRFSVGFGKPLLGFTDKHGTYFTLAVIPLGGYVKLLGEDSGEAEEGVGQHSNKRAKNFLELSNWDKIFIAIAGPGANFILSILTFAVISMIGSYEPVPLFKAEKQSQLMSSRLGDRIHQVIAVDEVETKTWGQVQLSLAERLGDSGVIRLSLYDLESDSPIKLEVPIASWHKDATEPNLLQSLGVNPGIFPVIGQISEGSPAHSVGLRQNDLIVSFAGESTDSWADLVSRIEEAPNSTVDIYVLRGGRELLYRTVIGSRVNGDETAVGFLGIGPRVEFVDKNLIDALRDGLVRTWDMSVMTLSFLKKMIFGEVSTGNLMGPIGIAKVAGEVVQTSLSQFLVVMALMSLSLGIINLLPIPMLDGGMVVLNLIELMLGRPVPEGAQVLGFQVGVVLIGGLFLFVTYNDLIRIF